MPDAPSIPSSGGHKKLTTQQKVLLGVGIFGGAIVGLIFLRKKSTASSTASSSGTGDSSSIDPLTDQPYGSAADEADLQAMYGAYGTTEGELGTYDPETGTYTTYGTGVISTAISNNQEWAADALSELESAGYDATDASNAIGAYLAGTPLSADQYQMIQTALGFTGQPPSSVPTPQLASASSSTTSSSGTSSASSYVGQSLSAVTSALSAAGIGNTVYLAGSNTYLPNAAAVQPYLNESVLSVTQDSPTHANIVVTAPA